MCTAYVYADYAHTCVHASCMQVKEFYDPILAYKFQYPTLSVSGKQLSMIIARAPEKYSSAPPLSVSSRWCQNDTHTHTRRCSMLYTCMGQPCLAHMHAMSLRVAANVHTSCMHSKPWTLLGTLCPMLNCSVNTSTTIIQPPNSRAPRAVLQSRMCMDVCTFRQMRVSAL